MKKNTKKIIVQIRVAGFLNVGKIDLLDVKKMEDCEAKEILLNIFNLGIIATDAEIEDSWECAEKKMNLKQYKSYLSELSLEDIDNETDLCSIDNDDGFYFEEAYDMSEILKPLYKKIADEIDEYTLYDYFENYNEKKTETKILAEIRDL